MPRFEYEATPTTRNPKGVGTIRFGPQRPVPSIVERQDPTHTEGDFLRDLAKVTQQRDDEPS